MSSVLEGRARRARRARDAHDARDARDEHEAHDAAWPVAMPAAVSSSALTRSVPF
jgi:hypothetical protein